MAELADRRLAEAPSTSLSMLDHQTRKLLLKEKMTMSESNKVITGHQPDIDSTAKETSPLDWRRTSMGLGLFTMVCALFAAAAGKETGSLLAKVLLVVAFLLIAVPIVTNIVNSVLSKMKRFNGMTTKPGS
jgi:hypothetical protein